MVSWAPDPTRPMDGRVHKDGTDTEFTAARLSREPRGQQRQAILRRFREVGERGSTDFENYEALKFVRPHVAGTRREELQRDGWPIVDSGGRRPTDTGRPAIVWTLNEPLTSTHSEVAHDDDPQHARDAGRGSLSVAALPGPGNARAETPHAPGSESTADAGAVPPSPLAAPALQLSLELPHRWEPAA